MKKLFSLLTAGFIILQGFTITLSELTKKERKEAAAYLKETRDYFLQQVKGLSEAQLNFKPSPDKWSIKECMTHIALSESFIFGMIEKAMKEPANPEKKAEVKYSVADLKNMLVDRTRKGQAPEPLQPVSGQFKNTGEIIQAFTASRNKHIDYVLTTKDDLHNHLSAHPFFGMMDGYQWIILMSGHSKRHTLQIEEVKANTGFPTE